MKICQIILLVLLAIGFFGSLRQDFYGRKEHAPGGFSGAVVTLILTALIAWVNYKAGAFSLLF